MNDFMEYKPSTITLWWMTCLQGFTSLQMEGNFAPGWTIPQFSPLTDSDKILCLELKLEWIKNLRDVGMWYSAYGKDSNFRGLESKLL